MYIVWKNSFTSFSRESGDGYFVSYKDKLSDNYSKNYLEAKKYKNIKSAITRLGIQIDNISSIENFIKANKRMITNQVKRDIKLNEILNGEFNILDYIFVNGSIEKINKDGLVEDAKQDVTDFINKVINGNKNKIKKVSTSIPESNTKYETATLKDFFN